MQLWIVWINWHCPWRRLKKRWTRRKLHPWTLWHFVIRYITFSKHWNLTVRVPLGPLRMSLFQQSSIRTEKKISQWPMYCIIIKAITNVQKVIQWNRILDYNLCKLSATGSRILESLTLHWSIINQIKTRGLLVCPNFTLTRQLL